MHWDVVMHGSREGDGAGIMGKRPDHVKVARHGAHEVQSQVTEGDQSVAEETETLAHLDESALVLFSFLREVKNK